MREIKFRAWHNGLEKMIYDNFLTQNTVHFFESEPITMMQYTGLKDKNGKEIYEGDIIKSFYPAWEELGIKYPKEEYITDVIWDNGEYRTKDFSPLYVHVDNEEANVSCEIIGNIYENPELLEK